MPVFENKRAKASHDLIPVMLLRGEAKLDSSIITFTWNISIPGFLFLDYKAIPQRGGNKKNKSDFVYMEKYLCMFILSIYSFYNRLKMPLPLSGEKVFSPVYSQVSHLSMFLSVVFVQFHSE